MTKANNNKGFVLLAVVSLIALIPTAILLLSRNTSMLVSNKRTTLLTAQCHDLMTSGLAWIEKNSATLAAKEQDHRIELDVSSLDIEGGSCSITVIKSEQNYIEIELAVKCSRGQRNLESSEKYIINKNSQI